MTKADLIDGLDSLEDDEEVFFVDKNRLQYSICDNVYVNNDGIFIKEDYQKGYAEHDVNKFFDNH